MYCWNEAARCMHWDKTNRAKAKEEVEEEEDEEEDEEEEEEEQREGVVKEWNCGKRAKKEEGRQSEGISWSRRGRGERRGKKSEGRE